MPIRAFYFYHAWLDSNTRNGGSTRRRKADESMLVSKANEPRECSVAKQSLTIRQYSGIYGIPSKKPAVLRDFSCIDSGITTKKQTFFT